MSMSTKLKTVAFAVLLGTATIAAAQTPGAAKTFDNEIHYWEGLSGTGTYTFHAAPTFAGKSQDPVSKESFSQRFADLQAASSNSGEWQKTQPTLTAKAADPEGKEPFAQRLAELQAASSDSGEWSFRPGANVPADEANSTLVVGKPIGHVVPTHVIASQK
jgi:hypothetical protein